MEARIIKGIHLILNIVSITALTVAILFAATFTIPKLFGIIPYIVVSGSMEPEITTGSVAFIDTKKKDPEINDIITFKIGEDKLATHRVMNINGDEYTTKGDANADNDIKPVEKNQIVGTYLFNIPAIGTLLSKLSTKHYIIISVWIIILNLISVALGYAVKDCERKNNKENNKS